MVIKIESISEWDVHIPISVLATNLILLRFQLKFDSTKEREAGTSADLTKCSFMNLSKEICL